MSRRGLALLFALPVTAVAAPVHYQPPAETAALAPGPNRDVAQGICATCHSVDYIITQPRSFADMRAFWTAEVAKMRKPYGAPIDDDQAAKIVDYLAAAYGK
ncbi:MAG: cytochrome c [Alphaproteobacteria bacterium]|nr:cytochrome c [Alphaproteobacteria bacterium]